jgi:acetyl esterase/lipase
MRRILPFLLVPAIACTTPEAGSPDAGEGETPDAGSGPVEPAIFCPGSTALIYDPLARQLAAFPDDFWTDDDASTATGVKVHLKSDNFAAPASLSRFGSAFNDISTLDGFGINGTLVMRFTGPINVDSLPTGLASASPEGTAVLVELDAPTPTFVPFETLAVQESGSDTSVTLVLSPMFPLKPATRYGFAVTAGALDASGTCLAPSETMKSLLEGTATDPRLTRLSGRYADLVAKLKSTGTIGGPKSLSAAFVFTTQTATADDTRLAADIRGRTFSYNRGACTEAANYVACEGTFSAGNYRTGAYLADGTSAPKGQYTLPVSIYLPKGAHEGPWKTVIYGHGLGGDRTQAAFLADTSAPVGYAVVALDAPKHGGHPDRPQFAQTAAVEFLGAAISLQPTFDGRKLRDNLRAAAYDKLQLVELLRPGLDVDGDSVADVDAENLTYVGVSLGGIMAPEFLANTTDVKVAVPMVPGARMTEILRESANFQQAIAQVRGTATDGDLARIFSVMQVVLDRGDPGTYLPHVLKDRLTGTDADAPQVLVQMAIGDEIVPNSSTRYYVRAAGIPLVGDELMPVPGVPHLTTFPVTSNIRSGLTAGLYEFDVVVRSDGGLGPAAHNNVPGNPVSFHQLDGFVSGYFLDGEAKIVDSYRELGLKQ